MQALMITSYLAVAGLVKIALDDYKVGSRKVKSEFVESFKGSWQKVKQWFFDHVGFPHQHLF